MLLLGRSGYRRITDTELVPQLLPTGKCFDDGLEDVEEQELYRHLQEHNFRLEQERIPDAKATEEIIREIKTEQEEKADYFDP